MERVINYEVYVACCRGKLMACSPLVAVNDCPRPDILSDDGEKCSSIPFSHFDEKSISASSLHPSKDPVPLHGSSSVIFPLPKLALVNLHFLSWASYHYWMVDKVLDADVSYKVVPVYGSGLKIEEKKIQCEDPLPPL